MLILTTGLQKTRPSVGRLLQSDLSFGAARVGEMEDSWAELSELRAIHLILMGGWIGWD